MNIKKIKSLQKQSDPCYTEKCIEYLFLTRRQFYKRKNRKSNNQKIKKKTVNNELDTLSEDI